MTMQEAVRVGTGPPAPAIGSTDNRGSRSRRHEIGFWIVAGAFLVAMAFGTVPAPLYPLYQHRDGFSSLSVTIVSAVYGIGVMISLVLAGRISDWVGRKRILVPAIALEAISGLIFLEWPTLPGLIVARVVTGLGVGMITATATAHMHELRTAQRPEAGPGRFEIVSSAANIGGLGIGALATGALAQYVSAPLRTPYILFVALLLLAIVGIGFTPETVEIRPERPHYRPQHIAIGIGNMTAYLVAAATAFTSFALFGLFTSLAPGFVGSTLHHPGRLLAGVVVFVVFGAAVLAQSTSGGMRPLPRFTLGMGAEAAGLIILAAGMEEAQLATFLIGGALAGAGAGILFKSAVAAVVGMALPEARGEALAGLFLIAYGGMIVMTIGLGITTRFLAPQTAVLWFAGILMTILAGVVALAVKASSGATNEHEQPSDVSS